MSPAVISFIATPIFIHSSTIFLRQTSFVPVTPHHVCLPTFHRHSWRNTLNTTLNMRQHRDPPSSQSPFTQNSLKISLENLAYTWLKASGSERFVISTAAIASVAFITLIINAIFHVSLFLALSAVPLLFIPLVFAFLVSFTAFTFLAFTTAAAGVLYFGTPLLAVSLIAKVVLPAVLLTAGIAIVMRPLFRFKNPERPEQPEQPEQPSESVQEIDDLERFDRTLRNRQTPKTIDVNRWNITDVLDELDYVGLGAYRQLFIEERIDGPALLDLTYEEIRAEFGQSMPLGDRMRLTRLVTMLRKQSKRL